MAKNDKKKGISPAENTPAGEGQKQNFDVVPEDITSSEDNLDIEQELMILLNITDEDMLDVDDSSSLIENEIFKSIEDEKGREIPSKTVLNVENSQNDTQPEPSFAPDQSFLMKDDTEHKSLKPETDQQKLTNDNPSEPQKEEKRKLWSKKKKKSNSSDDPKPQISYDDLKELFELDPENHSSDKTDPVQSEISTIGSSEEAPLLDESEPQYPVLDDFMSDGPAVPLSDEVDEIVYDTVETAPEESPEQEAGKEQSAVEEKPKKKKKQIPEGSPLHMVRLVVVLTAICAAVAGMLALVNHFTEDVISENNRKAREAAVLTVFPEGDNCKEYVTADGDILYFAADGVNVVGYCVNVSPSGYGGNVDMMVGITPDGKVSGIKIVKLSETPGVGTKIMADSFLSQFLGMDNREELVLGENVDGIGGATFSSRAVVDGVNEALSVDFDLDEVLDELGLKLSLNIEDPAETEDSNDDNGDETLMPGEAGEVGESEEPETIAPETEPQIPETEPYVPETEPYVPETDPWVPETEPWIPETDPWIPETEPWIPETDPWIPETDPWIPDPVIPETDPPETEAPETDAPETDAPETEPAEIEPVETDPVELETEPAETEPVSTDTDTDSGETLEPETETSDSETTEPETTETKAETKKPRPGIR